MGARDRLPETRGYEGWQIAVSAVVGVVVALLSVWAAAGFALNSEQLFRVSPTIEEGGVGADWVLGNTIPVLDFLVALVHAADVIMGIFILLMVVIHWGAFRRLASRMRQPGEVETEETVAADGGTVETGGDGE